MRKYSVQQQKEILLKHGWKYYPARLRSEQWEHEKERGHFRSLHAAWIKFKRTMMERSEFKCPRCGACFFGSSRHEDPKTGKPTWTRHCHGHGCQFAWPARDDWKYFVGSGVWESRRREARVVFQTKALGTGTAV